MISGLNLAMLSLTERLQEIMAAKGWQHADLMRVSGQSSSVVSQWLGKGSKDIKSITKLEAIIGIARESGYSMLWIAEGRGPRFVEQGPLVDSGPDILAHALDSLLDRFGMLLAAIPPSRREAAAHALAGWATHGGAQVWRDMFAAVAKPAEKRARSA